MPNLSQPASNARQRIAEIQNQILNRTVLALLCIGSVALVLSLARAASSGWQPALRFQPFLVLGLGALVAARNRITYRARLIVLLSMLLVAGCVGMASYGLAGQAHLFFVMAATISTVLSSKRSSFLVLAISAMVMALFMVLFATGLLSLSFDANVYARKVASWLVLISGFVLFLGAQISMATGLYSNLESLAQESMQQVSEIRDLNENLEQIVKTRTAELLRSNELLTEEIKVRERIEIELRQAQKLEAVGRLASGVAHEINTPIQFVSDSVHFVRTAWDDLAELIAKYQAVNQATLLAGADGVPWRDLAQRALDAEEQADLAYLLENVPAALSRSLDGLDRVATIVASLKEFAHADQQERTTVDLNRAILTTLTIARNEYKGVADVETDLGELPPVTCHVGEINQVILNLVVNAAHAIADRVTGTDQKGLIKIGTRHEDGMVVISIADTGCGIAQAIREKIFDPFFTTKEVGAGIGQGLFIARSVVVKKHGGTLTFQSEEGKGATFFVRLPACV
jgi:signal transduction histidine kinase